MDQSRPQAEEAPKRGVRRRHDPDDAEAHPPKFRVLRVVKQPCAYRMYCHDGEYHVIVRQVEEMGGNLTWQINVSFEENNPEWVPIQLKAKFKRSGYGRRQG